MKIKELIKELQKYHEDMDVYFVNTKYGWCEVGEISVEDYSPLSTEEPKPIVILSEYGYFNSITWKK